MKEFFDKCKEEINIDRNLAKLLSPLLLAYIGDAVYEIYIRTMVISESPRKHINELNKITISHVKAQAQSNYIHKIMDKLTDEEKEIVRRGRNAKSGTVPKNADVTEYKYATAFESLIGYLFIEGQYDRLTEIIYMSVNEEEKGG